MHFSICPNSSIHHSFIKHSSIFHAYFSINHASLIEILFCHLSFVTYSFFSSMSLSTIVQPYFIHKNNSSIQTFIPGFSLKIFINHSSRILFIFVFHLSNVHLSSIYQLLNLSFILSIHPWHSHAHHFPAGREIIEYNQSLLSGTIAISGILVPFYTGYLLMQLLLFWKRLEGSCTF
jgi:hypothetical protein